jgi:dTDP-4-dehydrorhamnose reductase
VRILVTGASGTLGTEIVRTALEAGHDLVACVLRNDPPGGRVHRLDVRDAEAVADIFARERPSAVIHTAYLQDGPEAWATNVEGTRAVAAAALAQGARLVHVSTDLVFDGRSERPYDERDEPAPVLPYGKSKLAAERLVLTGDPRALVVRSSLLYGGERPARHELLAREAAEGRTEAVFFVDELRSPIAAPDLAAALIELAAGEVAGVLHVAGPEPVDRYSLACKIAVAAGLPSGAIRSGRASELAPERPRRVVLDSRRARALVRTRLRAVDEVLRSAARTGSEQ